MGSFFDIGSDGSIGISGEFWIYWVLTVPTTIAVFILYWLTNHINQQVIATREPQVGTESGRREELPIIPESIHTKKTLSRAETLKDDSSSTVIAPVSWKSRVIGFGHAELDISDADRAEYQ